MNEADDFSLHNLVGSLGVTLSYVLEYLQYHSEPKFAHVNTEVEGWSCVRPKLGVTSEKLR